MSGVTKNNIKVLLISKPCSTYANSTDMLWAMIADFRDVIFVPHILRAHCIFFDNREF